jgi:hypothetical protein
MAKKKYFWETVREDAETGLATLTLNYFEGITIKVGPSANTDDQGFWQGKPERFQVVLWTTERFRTVGVRTDAMLLLGKVTGLDTLKGAQSVGIQLGKSTAAVLPLIRAARRRGRPTTKHPVEFGYKNGWTLLPENLTRREVSCSSE